MKRSVSICLFIISLILTIPLRAQSLHEAPVRVSINPIPLEKAKQFEMIVYLDIAPDVRVYSKEDHFFKIHVDTSEHLGKTKIILPKTVPHKNFDGTSVDVFKGSKKIILRKPFTAKAGSVWKITGYFQYQACTSKICYPPQKIPFSFTGVTPANTATPATSSQKNVIETTSPYSKGLWLGILGAFFAGILLSLTPCVYPMIGITVAVIGGAHASRKKTIVLTTIYMFGLSLVYAITGIIVASIGSTAASFFRSGWILIPIGVVFVLLGLSMFDMFTIQTSSSISQKVQALSGKFRGSYLATFFIGALSAFVVGPCISGPVIGLITFVANTGDILKGFAYFFALAWGMGILLFIAGSASTALPKAGIWMERIKQTLGIILIWAAFYFTRPIIGETFFLTACFVCLALGLQTSGLLHIPNTPFNLKKIIVFMIGIGVFSGFVYYQIEHLTQPIQEQTKHTFVNLDSILASTTKPVLLDFSAPWCASCKEIEEITLSKQSVKDKLRRFRFVHVDYDSNPELVKRYGIIGPPAFIFIDKSGKQIEETIVSGDVLENKLSSFDK